MVPVGLSAHRGLCRKRSGRQSVADEVLVLIMATCVGLVVVVQHARFPAA